MYPLTPLLILTFSKERETKNKIRFQQDNGGDEVGALYVRRAAAGAAERLRVTIEAEG